MSFKKLTTTFFHLRYRYYTFRGFTLHILYLGGWGRNTSLIAWFVFIVSIGIFYVYPNYSKQYQRTRALFFNELVFHWVPIVIIPREWSRQSVGILFGSFSLYLLVHGKKMRSYYHDPIQHNPLIYTAKQQG